MTFEENEKLIQNVISIEFKKTKNLEKQMNFSFYPKLKKISFKKNVNIKMKYLFENKNIQLKELILYQNELNENLLDLKIYKNIENIKIYNK